MNTGSASYSPASPASFVATRLISPDNVLQRNHTTMSLPARFAARSYGSERPLPLSPLRMPLPARRVPQADALVDVPPDALPMQVAALQELAREGIWGRSAHWVSDSMGTPYAFFIAASTVVIWVAVGAPMHWDDTWLMIMSTGASIMAFLMVFVVQTSQNRGERESDFRMRQMESRLIALQGENQDLKVDLARLLDVVTKMQQDLGKLAPVPGA